MFKRIREDIGCVFGRDPAVRSRIEVFFCYPGFHALLFYHVSHRLWGMGFRLLGRFVSHVGRMVTGIEIHPGAQIGRRFFQRVIIRLLFSHFRLHCMHKIPAEYAQILHYILGNYACQKRGRAKIVQT